MNKKNTSASLASARSALPKKVLVLGSGALKIGEAGEFDYSGSQAIKALKEEGIYTVLINPNIATNQTSEHLANEVFFLPVNPEFAERIIEKTKPDAILLSSGGQTALNCGMELEKGGILKKHRVRVLGTPVSVINKTEDRELFKQELHKIDVKTPRSISCTSKAQAIAAAKKMGYPLIVRAAFALGGRGSGGVYDREQLDELLDIAFAHSPQVLVEENLTGWKEIEYEVVRDAYDNCVTVCNMENVDPLGIHTGESIVIAPSQTLTNKEYHYLREIGQKVIRHLGIIGECNIQYALDPQSLDYRVIEVNARLSRSSALASKATGYPLAHVAAKLSLGFSLPELKNAVTGETTACFEPALDYLALKIPRWDLDKFRKVRHEITTEMKSVGEVMAIGRSFEEVMQKGLRMLQIGLHGFTANEDVLLLPPDAEHDAAHNNGASSQNRLSNADLEQAIHVPTPKRVLAIAEALRRGWKIEKINKLTGIDLWFLSKLANIVKIENEIIAHKGAIRGAKTKSLRDMFLRAKKAGFSDKQIGFIAGREELQIRSLRKKLNVLPVVKQIDTMAAEYPAQTNYLYLTYHGEKDDLLEGLKKSASKRAKRAERGAKRAIVLGSGAYCIGSSVEFDWCCVNAVQELQRSGYETIMINFNPETVSTDYDICDKLFFDELSLERVLDIYEHENEPGIVISMGGQIPNNLAMKLHKAGARILGTSPADIDRAENRHKFSALLDRLGVDQPLWRELTKLADIKAFAREVGYPVLVRPSYVLSGAAMSVAHNEKDLDVFLGKAALISTEAPVVVSKFEQGAKEIEIDAVAHKGDLIIYAIAEHIENAGVHSGDATIVLPPQKLYFETIKQIKDIAKKIARELNITGPFNIQFLAKNNRVMVIECNLRASRSFPFSSKVTNENFISIATRAFLGKSPSMRERKGYRTLDLDHVGVKAPQFSFGRLRGADPVLGVEMASTGEVACFGDNLHEAFLKAMISVGFQMPKKNILLSIGKLSDKVDMLSAADHLSHLGFKLFATPGTHEFLRDHGVKSTILYKASSKKKPNLLDYLREHKLDLAINIPKNYSRQETTDGYLIRRRAVDSNIPLITNVQVAKVLTVALALYQKKELAIKEWGEYK